ncbi:MAG: hypothetical protein WBX25_34300 [Rhodomicrobium sp.]
MSDEILTLYHATGRDAAIAIAQSGFRDGTIFIGGMSLIGIWVSSFPLSEMEGAKGDMVLKIALSFPETDIADFEVSEECKPYREWCIPARILNENAVTVLLSFEDAAAIPDPRFSGIRFTEDGGIVPPKKSGE